MKPKVKIDWDTVELVGALAPVIEVPLPIAPSIDRAPPWRGRSAVKQILSGAAQKARARGAIYTHTQIRRLLPAGMETLVYGWSLMAAAMENDLVRGIERAAQAISETSHRVLQR